MTDRTRPTIEERYWAKVDKSGECWIWTGARLPRGYGRFGVRAGDCRYAHRLAYEWLVGPIPHGFVIDHLCNRPWCVNPAHLEAVTIQVNTARGYSNPIITSLNTGKTHCPHGHPYNEANTYVWAKTGWRQCLTCKRANARRYNVTTQPKENLT